MIITSFSQKGFHEYGKRFIETFLTHYQEENLVVFYERGLPSKAPKSDCIQYINLYDYEVFRQFEIKLNSSDPLFKGMMKGQDGQPIYNYRYDANRFYRKVFAITGADTMTNDQYMAWFDADIIFHASPPVNFLSKTVKDRYLAYLGRSGMYSECGFIGFNRAHELHQDFMRLYWNTYENTAFTRLTEWHDCQVFDMVRMQLNCPANNLAKGVLSDHPYVQSVLGTFSDHLKGPNRKKQGFSPEWQERQMRNEVIGM